MATINRVISSKWQFIGTLLFDVSVDDNASVFYPDGKAITEANAGVLTADALMNFRSYLLVSANSAHTGTVTVAVLRHADNDYTADGSWSTLHSPPGTTVSIAADAAIVLDTPIAATAVRLESSGSEAADRTFYLYGRV